MKVKKANRVLTVLEEEKDFYKAQGYDVVELNENTNSYDIVETATGGKTYTVVQYNALVDENKALKKKVQELKQQLQQLENKEEPDRETLKKELADLGVEFAPNTSTAKLVDLLNEAKG
ncbi:TPA: hypothetical protein ACF5NP_000775 [Enterococcus faecium]|uniref:hypothetical protein n=1 Tax=Enterococcus TaxID=1350 RepID=UPI000DEB5ADB|nr:MULTISPECIES: hypothetical protein [Enterococcus]EGP5171817.1 hypothetical protein [Enterococcus faecium]MEB4597880.1 hypothetical protein [Enterococcus sp. E4-85]RBS57519.1 hypothetical protein EB35_00953 [Enterococcus faecium]